MSDILAKIVLSKSSQVDLLKARYPEHTLAPRRSDRSLYHALKAGDPGFILECKFASPSRGVLRADRDLEAIVSVYNRYAAAISVVTDTDYFNGEFAFLSAVRALTPLPVLCKDFIVSDYQIRLAAHLGADAVLLMLSVLDDRAYRRLSDVARDAGLQVLTEVSNEQERDRALMLGATIIGINNRDLRTLKIDLATTSRLAPGIPGQCAVVSESGISQPEQVAAIRPFVDGFLVGSALMSQPDLAAACAALVAGECQETLHGDSRS